MTKIENRLVSRYNFENDSPSSGSKDMGTTLSKTLPAATQRISLDKVILRTGTAGTVPHFDVTISEVTGSRVIFKHRIKRSTWVAGQRKYGMVWFPGGLPAANGSAIRVAQDTIDSAGVNHQEMGHVEVGT